MSNAISSELARVAELVDARDSKSRAERHGGSIPSTGTTDYLLIYATHRFIRFRVRR